MEPYYYSKMNKTEQSVYHAMKVGFLEIAPSFSVPKLEGKDLQDIFFKLRLDCPEIFYVVSYKYRFYKDASSVEILPEYLFNKKKVREQQVAMEARIAKLVRPAQAMTEWEKELYIHDFICSQVYYDNLKKPYSHEIIGPLGQGIGVCEGIAKTVKILCDRLGIWCIIAVSDANAEKGIKYRHAWNIVRIAGKYYHLDATFDNTLGKEDVIRYDYFNHSDKNFFRDHEPVLYNVPACEDGDNSYYKQKKLSFTKIEEVEKRVAQPARKGTPFTFQWRGGYLTKETLSQLLKVLENAAEKKGRHIRVSLNRGQGILQVTFTERISSQEIIIEEVNEDGVQRNQEEVDF